MEPMAEAAPSPLPRAIDLQRFAGAREQEVHCGMLQLVIRAALRL